MSNPKQLSNLVAQYRKERGWSQAELARRAGLSRGEISAIETNRLIPSVAAAIQLAETLGCHVEDLFERFDAESKGNALWVASPAYDNQPFWSAVVGRRKVLCPIERTHAGFIECDGILGRNDGTRAARSDTLLLAGCDPALGLLSRLLATRKGLRVIPLVRTTGQGLRLLGEGKLHAVGMHTGRDESANAAAIAGQGLFGYVLLRLYKWEEGIVLSRGSGFRRVRDVLRSDVQWVDRLTESGARLCMERLFNDAGRPVPTCTALARDHHEVVAAIASGVAQAGIAIRWVAEEAGLDFLSVQEEPYDLCFHESLADSPALRELTAVIQGNAYRSQIASLPGYHADTTGLLRRVA
ncbi:MAG: hypothetical protein AMXMBFR4_22910 [Candidatus Hydrogenedentota bacterium]